MARPRIISDSAILASVRRLLVAGGEKAVAFSAVAQASGLAPASLAQRYGTVSGMIEKAAAEAVDQALARLMAVEADLPDKGPQGLLKALSSSMPEPAVLAVLLRSATGRAKAQEYRVAVEAALARRLGPKHADAAPILFAAWQGQAAWHMGGAADFKIKDVIRRLG